ncbi:hypothetical protein N7504_007227 [Penicillium tannophilum]|nr:hypothetical protein N7504_007227 [Penicillium tannophilum]
MTSLHEPTLWHGSQNKWSASILFTKISKSVANIEATLMQTVGTIRSREDECNHCKEEAGPFSNCVTVEGVEFCANCHWEKLDPRCSLNSQPSTPKKRRSLPPPTDEEVQTKKDMMDHVGAKRALFEKDLREYGAEHWKLWQDFQQAEDDRVDQSTNPPTSFMREFRTRLQKVEQDFGKTMADATVVLDAYTPLTF